MAGKEKSYQVAELWTKSIGEYYKMKCKILAELLVFTPLLYLTFAYICGLKNASNYGKIGQNPCIQTGVC